MWFLWRKELDEKWEYPNGGFSTCEVRKPDGFRDGDWQGSAMERMEQKGNLYWGREHIVQQDINLCGDWMSGMAFIYGFGCYCGMDGMSSTHTTAVHQKAFEMSTAEVLWGWWK